MGKKIRLYESNETTSNPSQLNERRLTELDVLSSTRSQGFEGGSDYDEGLAFGMDQMRNRAYNQPWYDELANAAAKTVPGIALGLVENAGYLGELLFDWDERDYSNAFTEAAKKGREKLDEAMPLYREDDNVFSLGDTAWWFTHGQGLLESIGEFAITGAGVGGGLGKLARGVNKVLGNTAKGGTLLDAAAQLGTASSLAYTEGAMSGAEIYKQTYNSILQNGHDYGDGIKVKVDETEARRIASEAAAHTVKLNTWINTALNITSVNALFKTFEKAKLRGLLSKAKTEEMPDFLNRLTMLEKQGIKEAGGTGAFIREAIQEGLEEDVNLWAEGEGKIRGGLQKEEGTPFDRFIKSSTSQEGILNFALGSIGGIGQKVALEKVPYRTYTDPETGKTKRVSNNFLNELQTNQAFKDQVFKIRDDFNYFFQAQKNLTSAIESGNPELIKQAKEILFDVSVYKSIRDDNSDLLANELQQIAATDNTEIGQDRKTDAQRKGYTESLNDNSYKETAIKKVAELNQLQKEYNNLSTKFNTTRAKEVAFQQYLQVYRKNNQATELQQNITEKLASFNELATSPNLINAIDYESAIQGLNDAISSISDERAKKSLIATRNIKQAEYNNLKQEKAIDTNGIKDNKGLIDELGSIYTDYFTTNEEAISAKQDYNKLLKDKEFDKTQEKKDEKEVIKPIEDKLKEETTKAEKEEQKTNLNDAVNKDAQTDSKLNIVNTLKEIKANKQSEPTPEQLALLNSDEEFATKISDIMYQIQEGKLAFDFTKEEQELIKAYNLSDDVAKPTALNQLENINNTTATEYHGGADSKSDIVKETIIKENGNRPFVKDNKHGNEVIYKSRETKETTDEKGNTTYETESASTPIIDSVKILHSPSFNVGSEIEIRIEPGQDKDIPLDQLRTEILYNGEKIGYLPQPAFVREGEKDLNRLIRNYLVNNSGSIKTTVDSKKIGTINNNTDKNLILSEALPLLDRIDFAIGKDDKLWIGDNVEYGEKTIETSIKNGYTYIIVTTPNGKKFPLPVDINKASEEVAMSIVEATKIFVNRNTLTDEQKKQLVNFPFNLTDPVGFKDYINSLLPTTDLSDTAKNIAKEKGSYIQTTNNGIRWMKGEGAKSKVFNIAPNSPASLYNDLAKHIQTMYVKTDMKKIKANKPVNVPSIKIENDKVVIGDLIKYDTYKDYLANNTNTNILGIKLNDTEMTIFIHPFITFDTSFLKDIDKNTKEIIVESGEKAILASGNNLASFLKKRTFATEGVQPTNVGDNHSLSSEQVTDEDADELQKLCQG